MRVVTFLAQFAHCQNNQLTVVNGVADTITSMSPFALAAIVYIGWDETNMRHEVRYDLVDSGGAPVTFPGMPPGLGITMPLEVGRPPGIARGMTFQIPQSINFGPMPFAPGGYEFRVTVAGAGNADWNCPFTVRLPPQPPQIMQAPGTPS